jgi:hypothetical protein
MPIEIKELHIRVTVNAPSEGQASASKTPVTPSGHDADGAGDNTALVAECVEQVLQILEQKKER